jgi:beta-N-acetylhexosaminidase
MELRRCFLGVMLFVFVTGTTGRGDFTGNLNRLQESAIQQTIDQMTPEERIGQLFLVTFTGTDTSEASQIYNLIANHHVGGVVLMAGNDNFEASPNSAKGVFQLTRSLQQIEANSVASVSPNPETSQPHIHRYVPLFVGISQNGDGSPGDQILNDLTPLPSEMSIGATWSPDLANKVGTVMGQELSALGINLYFGPSLDVLESPNPIPANDLGADVFGGDPYWVSIMGSQYISGLHTGSDGKMLVVAKHFPGRGSADRTSEEEVATVRKSLEELKQIELAPFFAVTGDAGTPESTTDGLLLSHIRYQGFQGNIRATTKPVSFDAQALSSILSLPEFESWRQKGGVIVSDNLGTKAVRQFYSSGTDFPAITVARDAFVAGNDLLYLGNIVSSDAPDNYSTVLEVLSFFAQKYREDPAFAQRVDASVLRILNLKTHLYDTFSLQNVLTPSLDSSKLGKSQEVTFEVARQAASLLSPDARDLATLLPSPPQVRERIIFFTDTSQVQQCSNCPPQAELDLHALQNAIVDLYGPQSGNQTSSFRLSSYSFEDG